MAKTNFFNRRAASSGTPSARVRTFNRNTSIQLGFTFTDLHLSKFFVVRSFSWRTRFFRMMGASGSLLGVFPWEASSAPRFSGARHASGAGE